MAPGHSFHKLSVIAGELLSTVALLVASQVPAHAQEPCKVIERVSVASDNSEGIGTSFKGTLSEDGRYVAFQSDSDNLVPGDSNGVVDVFVRDRVTGATERVSVASDGTEGDSRSSLPHISANGRFVAFHSDAANLVPDDTNGTGNTFVHDRLTGTTELVSVASDGTQSNSDDGRNSVSADGRFVAFVSLANNLVPGDTNGTFDIFVHDRDTGTTERVNVASDGSQANGPSFLPVLSGNGRIVAFYSEADNLVSGDSNGSGDTFVHDRETGLTERVNVASDGTEGNWGSFWISVSADGRYVAFDSVASNLVPGDTNRTGDVFVHDRQTGQTTRVSVASDGTQVNNDSGFPSLSADGRYVAFESNALVPDDTNDRLDIYVHDRQTGLTERVSLAFDHHQGTDLSTLPHLSGDGRFVAFESNAENLVPGDTNNTWDVFVAGNCLVPPPTITWITPPRPAIRGGAPVPIEWELTHFTGPVTEHAAHFGITSVLGSSPEQAGSNGSYSHTFTAPNVGTWDAPQPYAYITRALNAGTEVLSPPAISIVHAGPTPPTVRWITPPPAVAPSGGQFPVEWQLQNYVDPATRNAIGWGVSSLVDGACNQPGGNGSYSCTVDVPRVHGEGTLFYTAVASNAIEFAFAPVAAVHVIAP